MSFTLPIELPASPANLLVPKGSGFLALYEQPLPTDAQEGETLSFTRIAVRILATLIEKEREVSRGTTESTLDYLTTSEAEEAAKKPTGFTEDLTPATLDSPEEHKVTSINLKRTANKVTTEEAFTTFQTIFPSTASLLVELVSSHDTICSITIPGTFHSLTETGSGEPFSGQCEFSGYLDLTNPVRVAIERVALRASIAAPLGVPSFLALGTANKGSAGFVNLLYDKEVK